MTTLTDTQFDRVCRKRIKAFVRRLRIRHAKVRQMKSDFINLKTQCTRLGAWDHSL